MATQAEVAEMLGLSDRWLRKLVEDGALKDPGRRKWDALSTARQLLDYRGKEIERLKAQVASLESQAQRSEGSGMKATEDARLQRAKADKAEMEAAEMRGDLIPRAQIADAMHSAVIIMKTRLNAIPAKVAPLAHAAPSVAHAERYIREQVDEALDGLGKVEVIGATAA
jgi:phage terminase Nu1 subunit (DNA packaging protein)